MRVPPWLFVALAPVVSLVAACVAPKAPPRSPAPEPAPAGVLSPSAVKGLVPATTPAILSAHLSRSNDPQLDGEDGLLVVFNVELDAAAMHPRAFVVSRADAGPVWPRRAIFAPASEDDENRSVLLVGDFADEGHPPTHVAVSGQLFDEDGARLDGLGASVMPFGDGAQVVAFQVLPGAPGRCEGSAQLVRTYWSDELRGVEPDDLARVRVETGEAAPAHPQRFDDHQLDHDEAGQDNVLDLCVAESAPIRRVWVDAGAFLDAAGHRSAAVELQVTEPGA